MPTWPATSAYSVGLMKPWWWPDEIVGQGHTPANSGDDRLVPPMRYSS